MFFVTQKLGNKYYNHDYCFVALQSSDMFKKINAYDFNKTVKKIKK